MPNVKSAKKRVKTNKIRQTRNRQAMAALRTSLKKVNTALTTGDPAAVDAALPSALSMIGRSRKKGLIHRNKAARQESRLMKKVNALRAVKA
jgi:small subunit ribosomal protein S20